MTPYFADDWLTIYQGDVRDVLPTLLAESVDCIVTSPPYWGLRDYGTASWNGGDPVCDHTPAATGSTQNKGNNGKMAQPWPDYCRKCGAVRSDGQIGLERTPEQYVANLVGIFRELRRVLKASGTCWLNLGDSFASGSTPHSYDGMPELAAKSRGGSKTLGEITRPQRQLGGLKPKDLVGIPWRVAFALQADGWYLRSDIIWSKPNPMPESVTDRPTKAHEYLFLLTKSGWRWSTRSGVFPPELPERCIKAGSPELGTILDPFAGSGTTGMVANRLSRRAILIDLNGDYLKQQLQRNAQTPLGLGVA